LSESATDQAEVHNFAPLAVEEDGRRDGGESALSELLHRAGLEVVGHGRVFDAWPAAAARWPVKNLPRDVVDLLAHDEDWVVRLFLAEHCAQAPADVLLEMVESWNGYSAARMVEHPNFPRHGVMRYADDPNPFMRKLALLDPESTVELVERFSRDADSGVRRCALRDQRLSAASVIRLLDDPHHGIRDEAAADPRLPTRVLATLLAHTRTAARAAVNPAVPETVMQHLLDR
jgi:hypothetical protein